MAFAKTKKCLTAGALCVLALFARLSYKMEIVKISAQVFVIIQLIACYRSTNLPYEFLGTITFALIH